MQLGAPEENPLTLPLPTLREDIKLYESSKENDGSPTWVIQDPVKHAFYKIGWREFNIISRWQLQTPEKIIEVVNQETPLEIDYEDVKSSIDFLSQHGLFHIHNDAAKKEIWLQSYRQRKLKSFKWMLSNYLCMRIPLVRPSRFLERTVKYVNFFYTKNFIRLIAVVTLIGVYLVMRRWDEFTSTFQYFFSATGFIYYSVAIIFSKIIHELAHAYTATRYGVKVSRMGVALLVFFPMLYTDTTESWKLKNRKERFHIAAAGVVAEVALASFALLLWSFLEPGVLQSAAFIMATVTWILTLLVNANPLMRFDGYYMFSDLMGYENLQDRSFLQGKWWLHKTLFGVNEKNPEETLMEEQKHFLLVYCLLMWVYRFFLFLGIALAVYYFMFKVLGIILGLLELVVFLALPIFKEIKSWWKMRDKIHWNTRVKITSGITFFLVFGFFLPWPVTVEAPAIFEAEKSFRIFPSAPSFIMDITVKKGQKVKKGDPILTLQSPDIELAYIRDILEANGFNIMLSRQQTSQELLERKSIITEQLLQTQASLKGHSEQLKALSVSAPFDGVVVDIPDTIHEGIWVGPKEMLALIVAEEKAVVHAFIEEKDLARIKEGDQGKFFTYGVPHKPLKLILDHVETENILSLEEPLLASIYKGPLAVQINKEKENRLEPVVATYRLSLTGDDLTVPATILRGTVIIKGSYQSMFTRLATRILKVFIRESGF